MSNVLDGATGKSTEKPEKEFDCEWKVCEEEHKKKMSPDYCKGGTIDRGSTGGWVAAGLEPWSTEMYGHGLDLSQPTKAQLVAETKDLDIVNNRLTMTHPEYTTGKHHLISIEILPKFSKLAHNADLVGYDINCRDNGSCFPFFKIDIPRHDLQMHRGRHSGKCYCNLVKDLLETLEENCIEYCTMNEDCDTSTQQGLLNDLNATSEIIYTKLANWEWLFSSRGKTFCREGYLANGLNSPR